jgi:hypothetical protein
LANIPKNWQIEHNGDKTMYKLSGFEHENYRKSQFFRKLIFPSQTQKIGCFGYLGLFLGHFGTPK